MGSLAPLLTAGGAVPFDPLLTVGPILNYGIKEGQLLASLALAAPSDPFPDTFQLMAASLVFGR